MSRQRLSNLFKLKIYDISNVLEYCIENNIYYIVNDYQDNEEHEVRSLESVWKVLLTYKPYNKYSR